MKLSLVYRIRILFLFLIFLPSVLMGSRKIYLLHGHGSPRFIMNKLEKNLVIAGYSTRNRGYRSMVDPLEKTGLELYRELKAETCDTVSFVTHSMGALVVRAMLSHVKEGEPFPVMYRMVMIAPPNRGAEIADYYAPKRFFNWLLGPNIERMQTHSGSLANQLPLPEKIETGIIAGIKGDGRGYNRKFQGDNDGRLTPERTRTGTEKEMIIVHGEHTWLTQDPNISRLVVGFIREGRFEE